MRRIFLLLMFASCLSLSSLAQVVPNGGFESWTNGNPDNWVTSNIPFTLTNVTKSSTAHSGSGSARGEVMLLSGVPIPPLLYSGIGATGFTISHRYATVSGFYQLNSQSGDQLVITISLYKGSNPIAGGAATLDAAASWTQFNVDIIYATQDIPDKANIQFTIGNTGSGINNGSFFLLDDVDLLGTATSVLDKDIIPVKFSLEQNYPNPFNPSTKIQFNLPQNSFVNLKVYNALGVEVATLINSVIPAGSNEIVFDASKLNSGVYFYTLKAGNNFVQTRKMILMK